MVVQKLRVGVCPYYASMYRHPQVGQYRTDHRWLDVDGAAFTSADPAWPGTGDSQYAYCGGDPVNRWDPSGLDDVEVEGGKVIWKVWEYDEGKPVMNRDGSHSIAYSVEIGAMNGDQEVVRDGKVVGYLDSLRLMASKRSILGPMGLADAYYEKRRLIMMNNQFNPEARKAGIDSLQASMVNELIGRSGMSLQIFNKSVVLSALPPKEIDEMTKKLSTSSLAYLPPIVARDNAKPEVLNLATTDPSLNLSQLTGAFFGTEPYQVASNWVHAYIRTRIFAEEGKAISAAAYAGHGGSAGGVALGFSALETSDDWANWARITAQVYAKNSLGANFMGCTSAGAGIGGNMETYGNATGQMVYCTSDYMMTLDDREKGAQFVFDRAKAAVPVYKWMAENNERHKTSILRYDPNMKKWFVLAGPGTKGIGTFSLNYNQTPGVPYVP